MKLDTILSKTHLSNMRKRGPSSLRLQITKVNITKVLTSRPLPFIKISTTYCPHICHQTKPVHTRPIAGTTAPSHAGTMVHTPFYAGSMATSPDQRSIPLLTPSIGPHPLLRRTNGPIHSQNLPYTHPCPKSFLQPGHWKSLMKDYLDPNFVDNIVDIARYGARIGYLGSLKQITSKNHESALRIPSEIEKTLQEELQAGRILKVDKPPLFYISSPIGAVQKKQNGIHTD
jgi:hypothetical protein